MRILALDIGEKRIGIAISNPDETVATPIAVLDASDVLRHGNQFRKVIEEWQPELIVSGLPVSMTGEPGKQAETVMNHAKNIAAACNLPVEFCDERLSSTEAKHRLRDLGYDERKMRGKVDMIAAAIFLQSWLDSRRCENQKLDTVDNI